jgi:hypothetical protein
LRALQLREITHGMKPACYETLRRTSDLSRAMGESGHEVRMTEVRNSYIILMGNRKGKYLLENLNANGRTFKEIGWGEGVDWM